MKGRTRGFSRAVACALMTLMTMVVAPSTRADTLTLTAKGVIAPTCAMSATQSFGPSNFNAAGTTTAKASVTCNQFFKVNATSANGAIKSSVAVSGAFTNRIPYSLKTEIGLDSGSPSSATCASAALVAGQSSCALSPGNSNGLTSNGQIATGQSTTLTVSWTPPSLPTLLKPGSYSDTITLTIATVP